MTDASANEKMFGKVRKSEFDAMLAARAPLTNAERCRSCFMSPNNDERRDFVAMINAIIMPAGGLMTFRPTADDPNPKDAG